MEYLESFLPHKKRSKKYLAMPPHRQAWHDKHGRPPNTGSATVEKAIWMLQRPPMQVAKEPHRLFHTPKNNLVWFRPSFLIRNHNLTYEEVDALLNGEPARGWRCCNPDENV